MDYNADLFTTNSYPSSDSKYRTELVGAFYHVFSNGRNDFHMAMEDKPSLEERIRFYDLYISKEKYPLYTKKYGLVKDSSSTRDIFLQVLGLPYECTIIKDERTGNIRSLTGTEILANIHFEDNLFRGYGNIDKLSMNVIKSNHYSVIGAINYLIEHGFYVLNPERIFDVDNFNENDFYPVYIDFEKVPSKYLKDKETSDKLVMDFVTNPFLLTKDAFIRQFKPLDHMSLEEKATIAFDRRPVTTADPVYGEMRLALKRYFLSMVRSLLNEFYLKYYSERGLFGYTVLDHDFEGCSFAYRMIYQGMHYDMYASSYRQFIKDGEQVRQEYQPKDYVFDADDRKKIIVAYNTVRNYLLKHSEYAFIPSVVLRMMGLPYPAFEIVKYFDFVKGDALTFISKFTFAEDVAYSKSGLLLTLLCNNGNQLSYRYWNSDMEFYFKALEKKGFYLSDPFAFTSPLMNNFLFSYEGDKNQVLDRILKGEASVYRKMLDMVQSHAIEMSMDVSNLERFKSFVLSDEIDGKLVTVEKYFSYLRQGYDGYEAGAMIKATGRLPFEEELFRVFIGMTLLCLLSNNAKKEIDSINKKCKDTIYHLCEGETFVDPYLEYPIVLKGRNFLAYQKKEDGVIYFDSKDKEAISNLVSIYQRYFDWRKLISADFYTFVLPAFGREIMRKQFGFEPGDIFLFLGIPKKVMQEIDYHSDIVSQLHFKKGISMFDREDHFELLKADISLSYLDIFSASARKGVYLLGRKGEPNPFYCLEEKLPDEIKTYLEPEFLRIQIDGEDYNGMLPEELDYLVKDTDTVFKAGFIKALTGFSDNPYTPIAQLAFALGGKLYQDLFYSLYHEKYHTSYPEFYFLSYPYKDYHVAVGANFYAYSLTGKAGTFALRSEDIPQLLSTFESLKKTFSKCKKKTQLSRLITYHLGLPAALQKQFYEMILNDDFVLDVSHVPTLDHVSVDECELNSYLSIHHMKPLNFVDIFASTQLNHYLYLHGLFIYPYTRLLANDLLTPATLAFDLEASYESIIVSLLAVSPDCTGIVKEILKPSETTLAYFVKDFIAAYGEESTLPSSFLFYCQEAFIYAYSKDELFLVKAINSLQNEGNRAYELYMKEIFDSFHLNEFSYVIPKMELYQFLSLFLLYLEQQILYRASKKMRK